MENLTQKIKDELEKSDPFSALAAAFSSKN